ncbi:hypothetical protein HDV05_001390 [Chytridiales sp. JEL 0842]|nr:hypothetical protein HDV05_001390 [Chytridiales sp. JEL 0842]
MKSLQLVAELKGHNERVWSVSWHPKSMLLASCSGDKSIRIWKMGSDLTSWTCVNVLDDAHKRTIRSVAFSPSGSQIATSGFDATTAVWEKSGNDYECVATLEGHENEVKSVAWSTSGSLLATCSRDKSVWIWECVGDNDFECLSVLQDHSQDVKMVVWHPSEEILASASYDDTIKIWREDDDDWYCSDTLQGHDSTVWAVDFNATGSSLVSVSDDQSLKVWTQAPSTSSNRQDPKWSCSATITDLHARSIYTVSWSHHNGLIATGGGDNKISLISVAEGTQLGREGEIAAAHGDSDINCVKWSCNEEYPNVLASAGDDGVIRLWKVVDL